MPSSGFLASPNHSLRNLRRRAVVWLRCISSNIARAYWADSEFAAKPTLPLLTHKDKSQCLVECLLSLYIVACPSLLVKNKVLSMFLMLRNFRRSISRSFLQFELLCLVSAMLWLCLLFIWFYSSSFPFFVRLLLVYASSNTILRIKRLRLVSLEVVIFVVVLHIWKCVVSAANDWRVIILLRLVGSLPIEERGPNTVVLIKPFDLEGTLACEWSMTFAFERLLQTRKRERP